MPHEFPKELYVNEPLESAPKTYDAYTIWHDSEEDDTIAIYELKRVCRVKVRRCVQLVDEKQHNLVLYERQAKDV